MRILFSFLLVMLAALTFFQLKKRPETASVAPISEVQPESSSHIRKTLQANALDPQKRAQTLSDSSLPYSLNSSHSPHEKNQVRFHVVDGRAIAFGDIVLGHVEKDINEGVYTPSQPKHWEASSSKTGPEIPFWIHPELPNPERVYEALETLQSLTPVRFVPYPGEGDGVMFEKGKEHCYSYLGKIGGLQPISLADGCDSQAILHEIFHALGFIHEHSRADRDQYIKVLWEQIQPEFHEQFEIAPEVFQSQHDLAFDYESIMLYDATAFALSPTLPTLLSLGKEALAPTKKGLSRGDILKIRAMNRY